MNNTFSSIRQRNIQKLNTDVNSPVRFCAVVIARPAKGALLVHSARNSAVTSWIVSFATSSLVASQRSQISFGHSQRVHASSSPSLDFANAPCTTVRNSAAHTNSHEGSLLQKQRLGALFPTLASTEACSVMKKHNACSACKTESTAHR